MSLGLSVSLAQSVKSKYATALSSGALSHSSTELKVVRINNIPFQVRYCPALGKKPKADKPTPENKEQPQKKFFDPFEDPDPSLHILDIPQGRSSHFLVLNKFPIIKNHFILATKANKPQTHFLEADDLWLTYQCLRAWEQDDPAGSRPSQLFAFFNSGPHSGASQPHRHLQLMPIDDMAEGDDNGEWNLLTEEIIRGPGTWDEGSLLSNAMSLSLVKVANLLIEEDDLAYFRTHRDVPFRHFATRLPPEPTKSLIHHLYLNLYDTSLSLVRDHIENQDSGEEFDLHPGDNGDLQISYNLAMTSTALVICPRRKGGIELEREDGSVIDTIEANGTLLGGTVLVKNEEAWAALKEDSSKLLPILKGFGIPSLPRGASAFGLNQS